MNNDNKVKTMTHIKYTLTTEQLAELKPGDYYVEIWQGLPDLPFGKAETKARGTGLRYTQDGNYIWVDPGAYSATLESSKAILEAFHKKTHNGKLNAWWVSSILRNPKMGETLESAIALAEERNEEFVADAMKKR